jgi:hypothetical protein
MVDIRSRWAWSPTTIVVARRVSLLAGLLSLCRVSVGVVPSGAMATGCYLYAEQPMGSELSGSPHRDVAAGSYLGCWPGLVSRLIERLLEMDEHDEEGRYCRVGPEDQPENSAEVVVHDSPPSVARGQVQCGRHWPGRRKGLRVPASSRLCPVLSLGTRASKLYVLVRDRARCRVGGQMAVAATNRGHRGRLGRWEDPPGRPDVPWTLLVG